MAPKLTPMMQQYHHWKDRYPDSLLFFRMGDFYEMFGDDAKLAAPALDLTLTARDSERRMPMCGIPYHALETYLGKALRRGFKVAICEQVEDPKQAQGIVKRAVVRVVSPGTIIEAGILDEGTANYIVTLARRKDIIGLAHADISTGEFRVTEATDLVEIRAEIVRLAPSEILTASGADPILDPLLKDLIRERDLRWSRAIPASADLEDHFGRFSTYGMGLSERPAAGDAAGLLWGYLRETQFDHLDHMRPIAVYSLSDQLILDPSTVHNLEIVENLHDRGSRGTLLAVMDRTQTPLGARELRRWLLRPLQDRAAIDARLDAIGLLREDDYLRTDLRALFRNVRDLERLMGRVGFGNATPRDLIALRDSLQALVPLRDLIRGKAALTLADLQDLDPLEDLAQKLEEMLQDEPPNHLRDGGIFKTGAHADLARLRQEAHAAKDWIRTFERREKERTGIKSLKVAYNKVFGYYIEVTKKWLEKVPPEYLRKQTLANAERYFTEELKAKEEIVLTSGERMAELERTLFQDLCARLLREQARIQAAADKVASLDVACAAAEVALSQGYCRPRFVEGTLLRLTGARHPVIETLIEGDYIAHDLEMDTSGRRFVVLTGPNMSGKSTFMREVALITLLAHAGLWVPAQEASLGLCDRIFTRVGARDDLLHGQSTFMVEMVELATILNSATHRSLVLLDEVGRGTSTFDGLSLAWAASEHLHDRVRAKTIFATHYHHLTKLSETLSGVRNLHIEVDDSSGEVAFLHTIAKGPSLRSYGIQVAKLAGVPKEVLARAREVLEKIEAEDPVDDDELRRERRFSQALLFGAEPEEHPVLEEIRKLDPDHMTPMEALRRLAELKKTVE